MPIKLDTQFPESDEQRELTLVYHIPKPSLYDVTFLSEGLMELVVVSTMIEKRDYYPLEEMFFDGYPYRGRFRYYHRALEEYYRDYPDTLRLKTLKLGSLELAIGAVGAVGSVIIPLVQSFVQSQTKAERVITIKSNDPYVLQFMEAAEKGQFGSFDEAFDLMRKVLQGKGHDISAQSPNVYRVLKRNASKTRDVIGTVIRMK